MDGQRIFDSDQVHLIEEIPRELIVVGAGIIGLEYASMFAALGVKVTLLDQRPTLLDFVDREIMESLCFQLRQLGTVLRVGEKVVLVGFYGIKSLRRWRAERKFAGRRCCTRLDGMLTATR